MRSDKQELGFLTSDKTLIEAKYNAKLEGKQKDGFDAFPAKRKHVLKLLRDIDVVDTIWET